MDIVFHSANRFLFKSDEKYNVKLWSLGVLKLITDIVLQVTTYKLQLVEKHSYICIA